jgi:ankyrin repeat protein
MSISRKEEKLSTHSTVGLLGQRIYSSLFEEDINTVALSQKWKLVIKHITVLGTDVNKFPHDKYSVLHTAVSFKKNDIVVLLLEKKVKTDVLDKVENATPLHVLQLSCYS